MSAASKLASDNEDLVAMSKLTEVRDHEHETLLTMSTLSVFSPGPMFYS